MVKQFVAGKCLDELYINIKTDLNRNTENNLLTENEANIIWKTFLEEFELTEQK